VFIYQGRIEANG